MKITHYFLYRFISVKKIFQQLFQHIGVIFLAGFVGGIIINTYHILAFLFVSFLIFKRYRFVLLTFSTSFILGVLFLAYTQKNISDDNVMLDNYGYYFATIIEPPEPGMYSQQIVVKIDGLYGYILAEVPLTFNLESGYKLKILGEITYQKVNESNEKYISHLNSKRILYSMKVDEISIRSSNNFLSHLQKIRRNLIESVNSSLPGNSSGLINGILFGTEEGLSKQTEKSLKNSGTTHIISASGFNVMVVYLLTKSILFFLNRTTQNIISILVIILYVFMIGWYILPAQRALIMLVTIILSRELGRKPQIIFVLLVSVCLILLQYPFYYQNISFQLSLFATTSLFIFASPIQVWLENRKVNKVFAENISATIAAIIGTVPISFLFFQEVSLVSPLSNFLVLPFVPILMYLGITLIIMSIARLDIIANLIIFVVKSITSLVFKIIDYLGNQEFANTSSGLIAIIFVLVLLTIFLITDKKQIETKFKS